MSWWSDKLAQTAPTPTAPLPSRVDPRLLPRGVGQNHDSALAHYLQQQQPQQQVVEQEPEQEVPAGHITTTAAIRKFKGTAGNESCPKCGSPRYVTPVNATIRNNQGQSVAPAAHCMDCGYPTEQGTLAYAAKQVGPVHGSRQGEEPEGRGQNWELMTGGK